MKKDFWLERWEREEIGFHQNEVNPHLCEFWLELNLARGSMVFVPLCGKSRDMLWLREQGHQVVGVELSAIAVQAFFKENGYTPQHISRGKFDRCEADGIRILCGDFFDLSRDDLANVTCSVRPRFADCAAAGNARTLCPALGEHPAAGNTDSAHYCRISPDRKCRARHFRFLQAK